MRIQDVKALICQLFSKMLPRNHSSSRQAVTNKRHRLSPGQTLHWHSCILYNCCILSSAVKKALKYVA